MSLSLDDDLGAFFDVDHGFAVEATHEVSLETFPGILMKPHKRELGVEGYAPVFRIEEADSALIEVGERMLAPNADGSTDYFEVIRKEASIDSGRHVDLFLRERDRTIYADLEVISDQIYIDEQYPTYPVEVDPADPHPEPVQVRKESGGLRRGIIKITQLITPLGPLPANSTILTAELHVQSKGEVAGVRWGVHEIIPNPIIEWTNWNQLRSGVPWSVAGCDDPGVDYDATNLDGGAGIGAGDVNICDGSRFVALLNSHKATILHLIARASAIGPDGSVAWDVDGAYLRISYQVG